MARNLWWTWQPEVGSIFSQLDADLWNASGRNPIPFLDRCSPDVVEDRVRTLGLSPWINWAYKRWTEYMEAPDTWTSIRAGLLGHKPVVYLATEFGFHESLPLLSGGLGVLSGDYLKSASDLGVPLIGVGLFYLEGYFAQRVDENGWQHESYPYVDIGSLPIRPALDQDNRPIVVSVETRSGKIFARVWRLTVGRVSIVLLDSDIPQNKDEDRHLTARLYGGDQRIRIRQELILGVGGIRALKCLGCDPGVIHLNEGYSAFAPLEYIRLRMKEDGLSFDEALDETASMGVFTTHTPVPANHDRFDAALVEEHLGPLGDELGLSHQVLMGLGRVDPQNPHESFCMTVLAFRVTRRATAVSNLHGVVSRRMWAPLWPWRSIEEIPIMHIMTGVHVPTWLSEPMRSLYDRYLPANWLARTGQPEVWTAFDAIAPIELWEARQLLKKRLVAFSRERLARQAQRRGDPEDLIAILRNALDSETLLIGWAHSLAEYKRPDLLFRDLDTLDRIVNEANRPVHFVFAGKAHPTNDSGKVVLQRIFKATRLPTFLGKIVFIEDYDFGLARELVQGVDVWLNVARRPLEASGISGQKVLLNGVLNCSVLDGWWAEAFDGANGFAIGTGRTHIDHNVQDERDANALYRVLLDDVIPMYYERDVNGLPQKWIARIKRAIRTLGWRYNTDRMITDYVRSCYLPAAGGTWINVDSYIADATEREVPERLEVQKLVFISAKSADYGYAQRVYEALTAHGVDAFFSRESLPALANADYRKEIDQALDRAKHMVIVTSSYENVTAPWVEAEWGMFISEKRAGRKSGNILTVLVGMDVTDLPFSLRSFEALPYDPSTLERVVNYAREQR